MSKKHKQHILVFNDSLVQAGTECLLVDFVNHLVTKNCKVTLLLPVPSAANVLLPNVSAEVAVRYLYSEGDSSAKRRLGQFKMLFATKSFLKEKKISEADYDQVVCFKEGFYAKMFSVFSIPKILWIHNIMYKRSYGIGSLKERLAVWLNKKELKASYESYKQYNKVICVSNACRKAYLSVIYGEQPTDQDIEVIYNAVDAESVIQKSEIKVDVLPASGVRFVTLTRNSPEKRLDRLIAAVKRLRAERYSFQVYLIGDISNEHKKWIEKENLQDRITLLGYLPNPYPYIRQSDWTICTSERESFSLSLLESMIVGTPVITTNCGGPAEIVEYGEYGVMVKNSKEGVYDGVKKVLDDPVLQQEYKKNLPDAVARFSHSEWSESIDRLLGLSR